MSGTVYLVGAGPGAPEFLTLRAARLLAQAFMHWSAYSRDAREGR